jgi:formamidopyrimidine-DNA glycosylase
LEFIDPVPELPEVETIRRQLEKAVVGKKILETEVLWTGRLNVAAAELKKGTEGARVKAVRRRAKLLMIDLDSGETVAVHLGMTGRLLLAAEGSASNRHVFVIFRFPSGQLMWEDYRRFGFMKLLDAEDLEKYLAGQAYGPEPLLAAFDADALAACLARRPKKKIKEVLMDQSVIAGLGNIYAAEALWFSRVRPDRVAGSLDRKEIAELLDGIKKTLAESIKNRGTSADAYVDANGEAGTNVANLKVYGREGKPCLRRDGGIIKKTTLGGRGTFWCPVCQR